MAQSLVKRLQIKADQHNCILNAPPDFSETLGELPQGTKFVNLPAKELDFVLLFAHERYPPDLY